MTIKDSIPESTNRSTSTSQESQSYSTTTNDEDRERTPLIQDLHQYSRRYDSVDPPTYNSITSDGVPDADRDTDMDTASLQELPPRALDDFRIESHQGRRKTRQRKKRLLISILAILTISFLPWLLLLRLGRRKRFLPPPDPPSEDGRIIGHPDWSTPTRVPLPPKWEGSLIMSELYFIEASLQLSPYSTPPPFFFHSTGKYPGDLSLVFHDIDPSDSRTSSIFVKFQVLFTDQRYLDTVSFTKHLRKDGVEGFGVHQAQNAVPDDEPDGMLVSTLLSFPRSTRTQDFDFYPEVEIEVPTEIQAGALGDHLKFGDLRLKSKDDCTLTNLLTNSSFHYESKSTDAVKRFRSSGTIVSPKVNIESAGDVLLTRIESQDLNLRSLKMIRSSDKLISNQIHLSSIYGGISTTLEAFSMENQISRVNLSSSFGGIGVDVQLKGLDSPISRKSEESFLVSASSLTGFVGLQYLDYSPGLLLNSFASSNHGGVNIDLPSSFTGVFDYQVKDGDVKLRHPVSRLFNIDRDLRIGDRNRVLEGRVGARNQMEAKGKGGAWGSSKVESSAGSIVGSFK